MVIFCRKKIYYFLYLCYLSVSHVVYRTNTAYFLFILHSQLCIQRKISVRWPKSDNKTCKDKCANLFYIEAL